MPPSSPMQQQQPATYEQFCKMVPACLSTDPTVQRQAEQAFSALKRDFPSQFVSYSLKSLREQTDPMVCIYFLLPLFPFLKIITSLDSNISCIGAKEFIRRFQNPYTSYTFSGTFG